MFGDSWALRDARKETLQACLVVNDMLEMHSGPPGIYLPGGLDELDIVANMLHTEQGISHIQLDRGPISVYRRSSQILHFIRERLIRNLWDKI